MQLITATSILDLLTFSYFPILPSTPPTVELTETLLIFSSLSTPIALRSSLPFELLLTSNLPLSYLFSFVPIALAPYSLSKLSTRIKLPLAY